MDDFVDCIVGIVYTLDSSKAVVEIGFLEMFAMTVDVTQAFDGVDRDEIWGYAHMGAVFLMQVV